MHLWYLENWTEFIDVNADGHRCGLRMRIEEGVDAEVRRFCKSFAKWLRREFFFPIMVRVYVKSDYRIKAKDGEFVIGTFLWPGDYGREPYIRIATGDYYDLKKKRGAEEAMWAILISITHELTHYFQYVNRISLTKIGEERQATMYSEYILSDYDEYLEKGESAKKKSIWQSYRWEKWIDTDAEGYQYGLRMRADAEVDPEIREICKQFVKWLRREYFFPTMVEIRIKKSRKIRNGHNTEEIGAFYGKEEDSALKPYVLVAVGGYRDLRAKEGRNRAQKVILITIARELTYYFQWVNRVKLTAIGKKRQATKYARDILEKYEKEEQIFE